MKITNGTERLVFFSFFFLVFLHVSSCLFVLVAQLEMDLSDVRFIDKCVDFGPDNEAFETYICSSYFVMTTVATVGYGDISP